MEPRQGQVNDSAPGTLYMVATPIGNLEDMTFRAVRILQEADLIAAEDTRGSIRLLNHFDIHTPMTSYHEHNRYTKARTLIGKLQEGQNIACITDAGTPGISDPGEVLVQMAHEAGIRVVPVPGACAAVSALITSGQPTRRFCFEAFLPADRKERDRILEELKTETRTIVLYEAPHRLVKTLELLLEALGDRDLSLCRELTKTHEEIRKTTLKRALEAYTGTGTDAEPAGASAPQAPRGEYVLVLAGADAKALEQEKQEQARQTSLPAHLQQYLDRGMERKEAMKAVARDRGVSRRDIYNALLRSEQQQSGGST